MTEPASVDPIVTMTSDPKRDKIRSALRVKAQELMEDLGAEPVLDLTQSFIDDGPATLTEIERHWNQQNIQELKRSAHSFKSLNQVYGLDEAGQLAADIESACAEASTEAIPSLIENLKVSWEIGAEELITILKEEYQIDIQPSK